VTVRTRSGLTPLECAARIQMHWNFGLVCLRALRGDRVVIQVMLREGPLHG
jgi:hypothetical protein